MMAFVRSASSRSITSRKALMLSCAAAALAVAIASPREARAQTAPTGAFLGSISGTTGTVTRTPTTNTQETITIGSSTATINWSPFDTQGTGTIDFLPTGNVATFTSSPGVTDYTVLNRIVPTDPNRAISMDGSVISTLQGTGSIGGKVWFYSPGGIVIGANAVFDVGGLLLTTADVNTGWSADASGFSASFSAPSGSTSAIQIANGAQLNALQPGSYIALVAPRIGQAGTVNVNGAAAFAAGEQLSMTMNQGLFDIQVDVGTTDSNGIVHTGTTTGPASTDAATDPHRIYMVAVPKNQALTMLLNGNIGFASAVSADIENGEIVLGAGYSIEETPTGGLGASLGFGSPPASVTIGSATVSSDLLAFAATDILAVANEGDLSFVGDVSLRSGNSSALLAQNGGTLTVGGTAELASQDGAQGGDSSILANSGGSVSIGGSAIVQAGGFNIDGTSGQGGTATIAASNGSISVAGNTFIGAAVTQSTPLVETASVAGFGGTVSIIADSSGSVSLHDVQAVATGTGQDNAGQNGTTAGDGWGGSITVSANGGGAVTIDGALSAYADGNGGFMLDGGTLGGAGHGGNIFLAAGDGSIDITGPVWATASGTGGGFFGEGVPGEATGGVGSGGGVFVTASGSGGLSIGGNAAFLADGVGGSGLTGGSGHGGSSGVNVDSGGSVSIAGTSYSSGSGVGGAQTVTGPGAGGAGDGGGAFLEATSGASISFGQTAQFDALGVGGASGGQAGDGSGGQTSLFLDGGTITGASDLLMFADGIGGSGLISGNGTGGTALGEITGGEGVGLGGTLDVTGSLFIQASGDGGVGIDDGGGAGGQGGDGFGGFASFYVDPRLSSDTVSINVGTLAVDANGEGAAGGNGATGGNGGNGSSGTATFELYTGTLTGGTVNVFATARGGAGGTGSSGAGGSGGDATAGVSTITIGGVVNADFVQSYDRAFAGNGGAGSAQGNGGNAQAGFASIDVIAGGHLNGAAESVATAIGGSGANGGAADGGSADVEVEGVLAGSVLADSSATGGQGLNGDGGAASGGRSEIDSNPGGTLTASTLNVIADATGGAGINGGDAFAGDAEAGAIDAGSQLTVTGLATATANATGGAGAASGTGGDASGGLAGIHSGLEEDTTAGIATFADAIVQANGQGGVGGTGGAGFGGDGHAGTRSGSFTLTGTLTGEANGIGGNSLSGAGGAGNGGYFLVAADFAGEVNSGSADFGVTNVSARGSGGAGAPGATGGEGTGGAIDIWSATAGSSLVIDALTANANGVGGNGGSGSTSGSGGEGHGGSISTEISGFLTAGDIEARAWGVGGDGGLGADGVGSDGGDGFGGSTSLDISGTMSADSYIGWARGFGGLGADATTAGAGGAAEGGISSMLVDLTGSATFSGTVSINASAFGGNGSNGGFADAGYSQLHVENSLTAGDVQVTAAGFGGAGSTGSGGDAYGGSSELFIDGTLDTQTGFIGIGGFGGNGATQGGSGNGGYATFSTAGSTTVGASFLIQAEATGGNASNGTGGSAQGGFGTIESYAGGDLSGEQFTVNANATGGNGVTAGSATGGEADLLSDSADSAQPTTMDLSGVTLSANGVQGTGGAGEAPLIGAGGYVGVVATGGSVTADVVEMSANGSTSGGLAAIESINGDDGLTAGLTFGALNASANGALTGGELLLWAGSGEAVDLGDAELSATGENGFVYVIAGECGCAGGNILASDLTLTSGSGGLFIFTGEGADVTVAGTLEADSGGAIALTDEGNGGTVSGNVVDLSGSLIFNGANVSGVTIALESGGDMQAGSLSATDSLALNAGGALAAGNLSAGNAIDLHSGHEMVLGNLDAGHTVTAVSSGELSVADLNAGDSADLTAGSLANVFGTVSAPTITVTSRDINVADGASLGVSGVTNLLTLNAVSDGASILIGDGAEADDGHYHLSEDGDILARSIVINAIGTGEGPDPDVIVQNVGIGGSESADGISSVTLNTGSSVFINGLVDFADAGDGDLLAINAGGNIALNTDSGGISITGSDGALAGSLQLTADNVWVAQQSILDQLQADPNFAGRDQALATNSGTANPDGYVRAGGITANVTDSLLVQNSGTADDPAGLTVGDGGLTVVTGGPVSAAALAKATALTIGGATVILSGKQVKSDGTVVSGDAFLDVVEFTGSGGVSSSSSINGCSVSGCSATPSPLPEDDGNIVGPESVLGPIGLMNSPSDAADESSDDGDDDEDGKKGGSGVDAGVHLIDTSPLRVEHNIDEPVTSGNDSPGGQN